MQITQSEAGHGIEPERFGSAHTEVELAALSVPAPPSNQHITCQIYGTPWANTV